MILKAAKLRELFDKPGIIRIVGAHNGLTARLIEQAGFEGIWASSLEVSASHAVPDANILTMTDYLNAAISMNDAVSLPVVVDVDQGYGNSTNVIHMVKKFEAAGIAGVIMEDKKFPKQNSLLAGGRQELASIPEFVGKIMAAKNTQQHPDFMVMARVEALIAGWGQEEALKRAKAYVQAGVDGILIHSKKETAEEIIQFLKSFNFDVPIIIVPTNYAGFTEEKMREYPQIKMVIYANHVIRSAVTSIKSILQEIKETGGVQTVSPKLIPVRELFELQGTSVMKEHEKKFLRDDKEKISAVIPAAGKNNHESFKHLIAETPVCMLDIGGKSILQRNKELLNSLGITDINVITGYLQDKITLEGIHKIENQEYQQTSILHSIMTAKEKLKGKTLLVYSDILFEKEIVEKLLKSTANITLLVDSSVKTSPVRREKLGEQDVVLVKATQAPILGDRVVRPDKENQLLNIGKDLAPEEATHEYIGMALFSEQGIEDFKQQYEIEQPKNKTPFQGAPSFNLANFFHLIQEMVHQGYKVNVVEIEKGWMEIHTFDDYKRACAMLTG